MERTIKKNWIVSGLLVLAFVFGLFTFLGVKAPEQKVYATENPKATVSQVTINGLSPFNYDGVTFDDANGVLTIGASFPNSWGTSGGNPVLIMVNTNVTVDLKVVINKNNFYAVFANLNGNLTIEANGRTFAGEVYVGENLTITGNGFTIQENSYGLTLDTSTYHSRNSIIYAGEKISIEGGVWVTGSLSSSSNTRSLLCAKSLEINTNDDIRLDTSCIKNSYKQAPIVFHSCNSANDLIGKLVIRQGILRLQKYYDTEDTGYNNYFGFVGYTSASDGSIPNDYHTNFDTENKAFTGYEIAKTDTDLIVKNRSVCFVENGGTGDYVCYYGLPIKTEPLTVTLPECPYTAPAGKQFAGWALESRTATPLKQPGDTFVLEDGGYEYDSSNYYSNDYNVYAIWENPKATASQVLIFGYNVIYIEGVTFADGVLTITSDYSGSNIVVTCNNSTPVDLTIVVEKSFTEGVTFINGNGNLTVESYPYLRVCQIYASENLTIKGTATPIQDWDNTVNYNNVNSLLYAGEKLSIEDSTVVTAFCTSNIKSIFCAKSIEINTTASVKISAVFSSPESARKYAPIVFHHCSSADDLIGRLVIKQGKLTLNKYYSEGSEYNSNFGYVGYTSGGGNSDIQYFDTDNKALTGYEYVISDKTDNYSETTYKELALKTRTVTFKKNGGTGDDMDYLRYLPVGKPVTLPECHYTAPVGKHFAGWALGSADGTIKQPGETFVLEEGADPDDWATYDYYPLYATWEDIPAGTYTVSFNSNGGTGTMTAKNISGSYTLPACSFIAPEGKQFAGWALTSNGDIISTSTINITENTELFAIWENIPQVQYTVSFNSNGGSGTMAGVQYAGTYSLPTCTFTAPVGKEFDGWALSATGAKIDGTTINITGNTELFALWKDVEVEPDPVDPQPQPEPQPEENKGGLSAGAIIGIVLGVVVVGGIGGFALVWFVIKKKTWAEFVKLFKRK